MAAVRAGWWSVEPCGDPVFVSYSITVYMSVVVLVNCPCRNHTWCHIAPLVKVFVIALKVPILSIYDRTKSADIKYL